MTDAEVCSYLRSHFPREDERCEWKELKSLKHAVSGRPGEDVISYVSALSNMEGGALVLGVSDRLDLVGLQELHGYEAVNLPFRLLGRCPNLPSEGLRVEELTTSDTGRIIWIVHVPRHLPRRPVYAHDRAWQRVGDSLTPLRPERLDAILHEAVDGVDWSSGIVEGAALSDLEDGAVALARSKYGERHRGSSFAAEIERWDRSTFLDKAKITIGGRVTRTALLLLGRPESVHYLPGSAQITWKLVGEESAYEHFAPPFLRTTTEVLHRIRNLRFKLFPRNQLLATEVDKYDPRVILEALHNCLAHQDYGRGERVVVTERVDRLTFENSGGFFDGSPEDYLVGERTPRRYRNPWLAAAMVQLGMIDTVGHGIHSMTVSQRNRFFPLPDYNRSSQASVVLEIFGHTLDENYTRLLLEREDLPLATVVLLDRVQKRLPITDEAAAHLRQSGLIEGRKPSYFVAAHIASATESRSEYIRNRAFDDAHYKGLILAYLDKFGSASRDEIERLILDKLSDALNQSQKRNKIRNLLHSMSRKDRSIAKEGGRQKGVWIRSRTAP